MKTLKFASIFIILISALFFEVLSQFKNPIGSTGPINKVPGVPQSWPISQGPDIQIINASADLSDVCPGGTIKVNYTLKFVASINKSSTPSFGTKFYLSADATWSNSDVCLKEQIVSPISANTSRLLSFRIIIPHISSSGNQYILVKADANNQVNESNENNNIKPIGPIAIGSSTEWVDLQVTSASVTPASVIAGGQVHISYKVTNTNSGSCGVAGASKTKFYLSDDVVFDDNDVYLGFRDESIIDPGASNSATAVTVSVTIPSNTLTSNKFILIICDADNQVNEKIETNYTKATNQISVIGMIETGTMTDIDGNTYKTVKIGTQWWMAENLKATHYRNGGDIPNVTDNSLWRDLRTGAYSNYDNDVNQVTTYGRLYNWFAVADNRKLAPVGWHVPSDIEWQILVDYLGGDSVAGGKMKETGTSHWNNPNVGATNESGFTALAGGKRFYNGNFSKMGDTAYFWSSTEDISMYAWRRNLENNSSDVSRYNDFSVIHGLSIRCVKD